MKINDTIGILLGCRPDRKVLSIDPDQSVYEALEMLAKYNIGVLLVCKDNRLVGIFSERDYARKGILGGHTSRETKVSQLMTSPVISVSPKHTVDECMTLMTAARLPPSARRSERHRGRRHLHRRPGEVGDLRPGTDHPGARRLHRRSVPVVDAHFAGRSVPMLQVCGGTRRISRE